MSLTNLDEALSLCSFENKYDEMRMRQSRLFTTFCGDNPAMLPRKCHKRQNRFYGGQNRTMETNLQLNAGKSYAFRIHSNSASKFAIVIKSSGFGKIERVNFVFLT